ncbi:MAG: preprotein translocase subunit YajC [Deltaproteobacteria bacterium]|nr:preprotein translocase subunit YajC [Deltaproteobacteria bacterium]
MKKNLLFSISAFVGATFLSPLVGAQAQAQNGQGGIASQFSVFFPLIAVFVIFYFLLIRPQKKQQQQRKTTLAGLKKGDSVVTTGGFHGKISAINGDVLTVELADNVRVKMDREGVMGLKKEESNSK